MAKTMSWRRLKKCRRCGEMGFGVVQKHNHVCSSCRVEEHGRSWLNWPFDHWEGDLHRRREEPGNPLDDLFDKVVGRSVREGSWRP
ncbi:MAG: hypothetical protein HY548_10325 [Elusimicrobia bacterium]|nr:hypothetical protein [Elusimicrobiota bacterium]